MRYIPKKTEPACLLEHKQTCEENNVPKPLLYKDFKRTRDLRQVLINEQHNVCCYCQRQCKAYRIEHSYPENGIDKQKSESLQLDYFNLFASCMDSEKQPPEDQWCDVAKGNKIIREFIKEKNCNEFFKYNLLGEITPNGNLFSWDEYLNKESLTQDEKDARTAIAVLNLNHHTLVEARKSCLDALFSSIKLNNNKSYWENIISNWLSDSNLPDFIELRLQYLSKFIEGEYFGDCNQDISASVGES